MKMEKPAWLDAAFIQKVLQEGEKDESIEVSSIIVKPATAEGDNYMSDLYRVTVALSRIHNGCEVTEMKSVLAKVVPQHPVFRELILKTHIYYTEISMMMDTLPKMDRMLAGLDETPLAARCFGFRYENPTYLIIEDLVPKGFRTIERGACLDLDHSLLAIRNIAHFHAASVALAEKDPKVTEYILWYKQSHMAAGDPLDAYIAYLNGSTKALGEAAVNWPELSPRISEKLEQLSEVTYKTQWGATNVSQEDFNVLNHGDCSLRNMLFRYDERQKPTEQIFVDFQHSHYGSPACDILSFFGSSVSIDVRFNDRELLVREYHNALSSTMAKLKCTTETPSFDTLKDVLRQRAFNEVVAAITALAYVLADKNDADGVEEFMTSDGIPDHPTYRGKMYRKMMARILPVFDSMGLLDM